MSGCTAKPGQSDSGVEQTECHPLQCTREAGAERGSSILCGGPSAHVTQLVGGEAAKWEQLMGPGREAPSGIEPEGAEPSPDF